MNFCLTCMLLYLLFPLPRVCFFLLYLSSKLLISLKMKFISQCLQTHTPNGASPTPTPVITSFTAPHWPLVSLTRQELLNRGGERNPSLFHPQSLARRRSSVTVTDGDVHIDAHKKNNKKCSAETFLLWVQSPLLGIPFWAGGGASGRLLTIPLPSTRPSSSIEGRTFCTHRILGQGSLFHHLQQLN